MPLRKRLVRLGGASARNAVQINKGCLAAPRAATSLPSMSPRAVVADPLLWVSWEMLWNPLVLSNPEWAVLRPSAQSKQVVCCPKSPLEGVAVTGSVSGTVILFSAKPCPTWNWAWSCHHLPWRLHFSCCSPINAAVPENTPWMPSL